MSKPILVLLFVVTATSGVALRGAAQPIPVRKPILLDMVGLSRAGLASNVPTAARHRNGQLRRTQILLRLMGISPDFLEGARRLVAQTAPAASDLLGSNGRHQNPLLK